MNTEIWFLIPHEAKGDVLCLACSWEAARDNGAKQRSKGINKGSYRDRTTATIDKSFSMNKAAL
jgi:hypothetical protein